MTFSFGSDQYTRFTNQKISTYAGQSSGTAEILFQDLNADMPVFQKAMSSIVTRLDPETQLRASMRFEQLHLQF